MISRRNFFNISASALLITTTPNSPRAQASRVGAVMLHGKQSDPSAALGPVAGQLSAAGVVVASPNLPWSSSRYLSGSWAEAMQEIGSAVASLRDRGASRVVLVGHSMGCPAAMSYAAQDRGIAGLVLTAPGHSPVTYMRFTPEIRDSVAQARAMVKAGRGAEPASFFDNNQGRIFQVTTTAAQYLSYFAAGGPNDMHATMGRIGCPVLWVVGTGDGAIRWGDPIARRVVRGPKSRYLAVPGAGHGNAPAIVAGEIAQWVQSI